MLAEAFDYKQWADRRALDAIRRVGPPPSAAFMRQQLNHMVIVEELFRARLLGVPAPHPSTNTDLVPELDELADRLIESDRWFARYVAGLQPGSRSESISFQFVDGMPGTMTRLEILFHIVNHGTYHRGAIARALDLAGVPHPADTYTVFIHSVEPERRNRG